MIRHLGLLCLLLSACTPSDPLAVYGPTERIAFDTCRGFIRAAWGGSTAQVPVVKNWGRSPEASFVWNGDNKVRAAAGEVTASCTINAKTGQGWITVMGADAGKFSVAPFDKL